MSPCATVPLACRVIHLCYANQHRYKQHHCQIPASPHHVVPMLIVVHWISRPSAAACLVTMAVHPAVGPSAQPIRSVPSAWPASISIVAIPVQASVAIRLSVRLLTIGRSASVRLATQAAPTITASPYDQLQFLPTIQFQLRYLLLLHHTYSANPSILACPLPADHTHSALPSVVWSLAAARKSMWVCHPIAVPSVCQTAIAPLIVPASIASAVILVQVFVVSMPCAAPQTTNHNVCVRLD